MAATFKISFITPDKVLYDDEAVSLFAPGEEGYLEMLAHHVSFVSTLVPGKLIIQDPAKRRFEFRLNGNGLLESHDSCATILAESVEVVSEGDFGRGPSS